MAGNVTLKEICEMAGVGKTTASRVLNNKPVRCRAETREKILRLAREFNYRPSTLAQSLRKGKTNTVGLVAPLLSVEMDHIEHAYRKLGYSLSVMSTQPDYMHQSECLLGMQQRGVDGLHVISPAPGDPTITSLQEQGFPMVISCIDVAYPEVDTFFCDLTTGTRMLMDHLIQLGHRRIAGVIQLDSNKPSAVKRYEGWKQGLERIQVIPQRNWCIQLEFSKEEAYYTVYRHGYEAGLEFIRRFAKDDNSRPTAVYTPVDEVAVGMISAFTENGWKVPQDISIVGMHALEVGRYCQVPVTSVDIDHIASYLDGIEHLVKLIEGKCEADRPFYKRYVPKLVERSSTAKPAF